MDNLDTASYKDAVGTERLRHQYSYDAEENLWQVVENRSGFSSRNYTRQFDTRNRLTKTTDAYNKTVDFDYDTANNLTQLRDASNRVTTYNYDGKNQLDKVFQASATIADYDWYEDGLLKQVRYSATSKRDYVYDDADRVTSITNTIGTGSESFDYSYDANSNRASEIRKIDGTIFKTAAYDYDKLNRLTSESYTASSVTNQINFTYDAVGNRITEIGTSQTGAAVNKTATYDDLNRLTNLTQGGLVNDFEYDGNSNLTKVKLNGVDNETFEYDVRNQLSRYTSIGNGITATFDYDFERKRLSKTSASVRRDYVYAGNQVISEFQNNVASASYNIGAGEIVKSEFASEGTRFYFSDALGSTTSLADAGSSLINRNDYDAFGEIVGSSGSTANAIGYTGQRLDAESGLMALGNGERYYNPSYGRFIQQDSYAGMPNMPQSLNRFSYGYNNPFRFTDPSGNIADDNRGSLANSAREYGLNKNGDNNWWNITKNWAARTGYDLWDTVSLGTLSRQEETVAQVEKGEITQEQFEKQTGYNAALGFAKVGLMIATAGAGNALMAGAGLATRIGIGAGLGVAEQFGNDALEMAAGFRKDFSSAGTYALSAFTGGLFGAASPGKAATAYAKESKMTLRTELKFLKDEAKELGQSIGQRLNPRNYNFKLNQNVLGSNGGGFDIEFNPKTNVAKTEANWKAKEVNGRKVYQREDLFNPEKRSSWKSNDGEWKRGNNVERMKDGKSPIGTDGREVQLHHLTQTEINGLNGTRGSVAEVLTTFHQRFTRILHFPKPKIPRFSSFRKNLDGSRSTQSDEFDSFRNDYWKIRAEDFE